MGRPAAVGGWRLEAKNNKQLTTNSIQQTVCVRPCVSVANSIPNNDPNDRYET